MIRVHLFPSSMCDYTHLNVKSSVGGLSTTVGILSYCLFKLPSFWAEPKICEGDESLESKDKDVLSPQHYEQCVGGWGAKLGTKGPVVVCIDSVLRASHS